jgi:ribonuclease BN (tRNA processing enzyme)
LLELGTTATQISHAFFSHHQYDHIGDYPRLLLTRSARRSPHSRWDTGSLAELAQSANVRNLVLSHVTSQFDRPGMRERVLREICEVFSGDVFFGEDLMEIPFTSPAAAKLD